LIISLKDIYVEYDSKIILNHIDFNIADNDKIGLIGINGTGKSSLLKIINNYQDLASIHYQAKKNLKIAYLDQDTNDFEEEDLVMYVSSHSNDMSVIAQAKKILNNLGLTNHDIPASQLSGGQKKRLALAKTLLTPCDLLLLDEPTNHLDINMILWLEDYLKKINKAILMITHDRYFLESIVNKIIELDNGNIFEYPGSYQNFLEGKAFRLEDLKAKSRKQVALLKKEKEWMMQGPKARSTKSKDRIERYEALKDEKIILEKDTLQVDSLQSRMGKKILEINDLSIGYEKPLIEGLTYTFKQGDRIGIVGENGSGKTTLLNTLNNQIPPLHGTLDFGSTVQVGYFSQHGDDLNNDIRVIDYIRDKAEFIETKDGFISASTMLERFLFVKDAQYQLIGKLSGGEKRRLLLLGVLMKAPNFLILDEPTNDLDVETLTILEDYLLSFNGVIIVVSHDRYFMDKIIESLWIIKDKHVVFSNDDYSIYLEQDKPIKEEVVEKKVYIKEKKERMSTKELRELDKLELEMEELENKINALSLSMSDCYDDYEKISEINAQLEESNALLNEKTERWLELSEKLERVNNLQ